MLALPLSIIGAVLGLLLANKLFDMVAFIGLIMLMGLVTKNSILLVDYTNVLRRRGLPRAEAIVEAGSTRLRPILMTTLAMILGMIPVAAGFGSSSSFRAPDRLHHHRRPDQLDDPDPGRRPGRVFAPRRPGIQGPEEEDGLRRRFRGRAEDLFRPEDRGQLGDERLRADVEGRPLVGLLPGRCRGWACPCSSIASPPASQAMNDDDGGLVHQPQLAVGPVLLGIGMVDDGRVEEHAAVDQDAVEIARPGRPCSGRRTCFSFSCEPVLDAGRRRSRGWPS